MTDAVPVAVVTAAANGIGAATAERFAADGYHLVLVDLDERALEDHAARLRSDGRRVELLGADVTSPHGATAVATHAVTHFGRIDALANVVGGSRPGHTAVELAVEDWERMLTFNLTSTFLMSRAIIPVMEAAGGGAIVNVSSGAGVRGMPRNPGYVAAKAGVIGLTKALALDHGRNGVRVNCVAPGPVLTPLMRTNRTPAEIEWLAQQTLAGHVADPRELADVIVWLCSEQASYVIGQTIEVNGGPVTGI